MANNVLLTPSKHTFAVEKHETILEAALRSGLSVDYGCSNGTCGKCTAKLLSGETEKTAHQDYVFSEAEKIAGHILMCCCTTTSDILLETSEASHTDEIPLQHIKVKIKKIETPTKDIRILHVRSPRTQRLRYIAGQRARLINSKNESRTYSIASCPCDAFNQQFHLAYNADDDFLSAILDPAKTQQTLEIEGPSGSFTLQEKSTRAVLFLAYNTGFSAIKGLVEHALSLELSQNIYLVWMTNDKDGHYMHNYCRSIADAVDNFQYLPVTLELETKEPLKNKITAALTELTQQHPQLNQYDIYASGDTLFTQLCEIALLDAGANSSCLYLESLST